MVANRHISKIVVAVMAAAVILCILAVVFSGRLTELLGGTGVRMEYESKLFDTDEPITVDIRMDEDEWNRMLSDAISEEYYACDVTVNGRTVKNVAIRPKGNTSLSAIAMDPDTDRYSLKLEFDHFVKGQTCFGLDKLILNNNYADATNMKEAVIYDMFAYIGADASLYNYAEVYVNGEYRGVYLALEAVEESFMLRSFGTRDGELYKPDSMEMGGGDRALDADFPDFDFSELEGSGSEETPPISALSGEGGGRPSFGGFPGGGFDFDPENMPDFGGFSFDPENMPAPGDFDFGDLPDMGDFDPSAAGGFSMGGGGANLNYVDDELDSYSTIWEGEITNTGKADRRRVVAALKNIAEGSELEKYLDVDNVLRYMAVHTFSVNMDSLSGSMAHNYYLYEYEGRLSIFPWDYNLSFGGMSMGASGASAMVNDAIDTPFSGTRFFDALLENGEYLERYHEYLRQLVDEYVNGGLFDAFYERVRGQIDALVETDPTAFYTYDEYLTAAEMLYKTVKLRAESIDGQLNGTIPSTDSGQRLDSSALIDASEIDVEAMGQFNMGGFGGGFDSSREESPSADAVTGATEKPETDADAAQEPGADGQGSGGQRPSGFPGGSFPGNLPEGFDPGNMPQSGGSGFAFGNPPDAGSFDPGDLPEGFDPENLPDAGSFEPETLPSEEKSAPSGEDGEKGKPAPEKDADADKIKDAGGKRPDFSGMSRQSSGKTRTENLKIYGACLILALAALIAVKKLARRR